MRLYAGSRGRIWRSPAEIETAAGRSRVEGVAGS